MTGLRDSYRAEVLKLGKRPAMWILGGVFLLLAQVFGYLLPYVAYRTGTGGFAAGEPASRLLADVLPGSLVPNTLGGFPMFAGAIALVIGAIATGSEYGWRTLKSILTVRPGRLSVLGGKLLAIVTVGLVLVVVVFAAAAGSSAVIAAVEGKPLDWPALGDLARGFGAGWLIIGMWSLFGAALGILFRGTSLAIGLGLVWALVVENLVRGFAVVLDFLDALQKWLPGVNAGSLVASLGATTQDRPGGTPGVTDAVTGTRGLTMLVAYVLALGVIATLTLVRQDVE
jgi:ABC-type transport system involved in multi-copper enzyme maturation permease subunit